MHDLARQATSFLFVPATRPERLGKALDSGADMVIADWEDAVAPADKDGARQALAQAVGALEGPARARLLVRINAEGTPWHADDLRALAQLVEQGVAGAMVSKAERAQTLHAVAQAAGARAAVLPLIESVAGLDAADALAAAPRWCAWPSATWTSRSMRAWPASRARKSCCPCAWPWSWPRAAPALARPWTA